MNDLIILGSTSHDGAHAAEMVEIVERINRRQPTWNLRGYLVAIDTSGEPARQFENGYPVLGTADDLHRYPDAFFAGVGDRPPGDAIPPERLATLVDPSCFVSRTARLEPGCVLYPHCFVGLNARLGSQVFCLSGVAINHDVVLEDRVCVTSRAVLAGKVHVEADSYIGQAATVRQRLRIGRGSLIGTGSVVVDDVPPRSVVVGNPARKLRDRVDATNREAFIRQFLASDSDRA